MAILDSLLAIDTVMILCSTTINNTELKLVTSEYTLFDHVKACYFYLWEFIFEEQQDLGMYFQREGPL